MNINYIRSVQRWSKRLPTIFTPNPATHVVPAHLPRLLCSDEQLPTFVRDCPTTMSIIPRYRLLAWDKIARPVTNQWFGKQPTPLTAYVGAFLLKIDQKLMTISYLRRFLQQHPALIWAFGFPLEGHSPLGHGFDADLSLPSRQQLGRVLRALDNSCLQILLTEQVTQLQSLLPAAFGQIISLDTKHILAWVKQNNPREYIKEGRYDKANQPAGDKDCKVGCKRRHNRVLKTPAKEGKPAENIPYQDKEFYWGYASGAVVTKVPDWGEFVLAEMTETFEKADVRYFFPLMTQVEKRLGFRPRFGALDAAYDAFYVYEFFDDPAHDGFAAVPLKQPKAAKRQFDDQGRPLCAAGLPMPVLKQYVDRTKAIMPHQRAIHACPLLHPEVTGESCPIAHKQWEKGGCRVNVPVGSGPRLRHQIDRQCDVYKKVYAQRTAVERIFSQAKHLGIERPKLRNHQAITNQNTLIYILINLRAMQAVLAKLAAYK